MLSSVLREEWLVAEQMADGVRADMFYEISSDANAYFLSPSLLLFEDDGSVVVSDDSVTGESHASTPLFLQWLVRETANSRAILVAVSVSVMHALPDQRACVCTHAHARLETVFY